MTDRVRLDELEGMRRSLAGDSRDMASITAPEFMSAAVAIESRITAAAHESARETFKLWPPFAALWIELSSGQGRISDPLAVAAGAFSLLLSELAFPGRLHDGIVAAAAEAAATSALED